MKLPEIIAAVIATVLIVGLGLWLRVYQYGECREFGHSVLYCAILIR